MSTEVEKNMQVMKQWFEIVNTGDYEQVMKALEVLFTKDYTLHDPSFPSPKRGIDIAKADCDEWLKNNSGIHMVIEDLIGMGEKTATRAALECVDNKTQKKRKTVFIFFSRFENGRIAEEWQVTAPGS
jgi:ketosteroid isomerase-like protein